MARPRQIKIAESFTQRTQNINRYFNELNLEGVLTAEQEFDVATKAAAGDKKAIDKLVTANLRFAVSVAKQFAPNGEILEELIAHANIGLTEAASKFDPTRGFKFISFAVWYIRKEIMYYFNYHNKTVRVPMNVNQLKSRYTRVEGDLATKLGRTPNDDEVLEELRKEYSVTDTSYERMLESKNGFSVQLESNSSDEEWSPIDYLESDISPDLNGRKPLKKLTKSMFSCLDTREKFIISKSYGLDDMAELTWTPDRIAEHLGVTSTTITTVKTRAIRKMRSRLLHTKEGNQLKRQIFAELS